MCQALCKGLCTRCVLQPSETTIGVSVMVFSHFVGEETEVQTGDLTYPGPCS